MVFEADLGLRDRTRPREDVTVRALTSRVLAVGLGRHSDDLACAARAHSPDQENAPTAQDKVRRHALAGQGGRG
jgi:hypothetical protein